MHSQGISKVPLSYLLAISQLNYWIRAYRLDKLSVHQQLKKLENNSLEMPICVQFEEFCWKIAGVIPFQAERRVVQTRFEFQKTLHVFILPLLKTLLEEANVKHTYITVCVQGKSYSTVADAAVTSIQYLLNVREYWAFLHQSRQERLVKAFSAVGLHLSQSRREVHLTKNNYCHTFSKNYQLELSLLNLQFVLIHWVVVRLKINLNQAQIELKMVPYWIIKHNMKKYQTLKFRNFCGKQRQGFVLLCNTKLPELILQDIVFQLFEGLYPHIICPEVYYFNHSQELLSYEGLWKADGFVYVHFLERVEEYKKEGLMRGNFKMCDLKRLSRGIKFDGCRLFVLSEKQYAVYSNSKYCGIVYDRINDLNSSYNRIVTSNQEFVRILKSKTAEDKQIQYDGLQKTNDRIKENDLRLTKMQIDLQKANKELNAILKQVGIKLQAVNEDRQQERSREENVK